MSNTFYNQPGLINGVLQGQLSLWQVFLQRICEALLTADVSAPIVLTEGVWALSPQGIMVCFLVLDHVAQQIKFMCMRLVSIEENWFLAKFTGLKWNISAN